MHVALKSWLEKHNWYIKVRYHPFSISVWLKFRKSVNRGLLKQKLFYQLALKDVRTRLIIDVGSNEGFITSIFRSFGFKVIAVEPSPRNFSILKIRFKADKNVVLIKSAVSSSKQTAYFFGSRKDYATGTLSEKWRTIKEEKNNDKEFYDSITSEVPTLSLDDIINRYGVPGFIKIDVEGYEQIVLKGLTQKVSLISFEAVLPHFLEETLCCIEHLFSITPDYRFNYACENKFAFNDFVSKEELTSSLKSLPPQTIEVFCKV